MTTTHRVNRRFADNEQQQQQQQQQSSETDLFRPSLVQYHAPVPYNAETSACVLPRGTKGKLADVLKTILPQEVAIDSNGQQWTRPPSARHAERKDVVTLQNRLDELLQERQARDNGLCPVREELYSQCFDELIRQVAIESPHRGLLLQRVRNEVRMTLAAYQTLYESSITFGVRKTLQAEQGNVGLAEQIHSLKDRKAALIDQLQRQQSKYDAVERRTAEARTAAEKKRTDEKDFLRHQAIHLESFLKTVE